MLDHCRLIPWTSPCELFTCRENLCVGRGAAAEEKPGLVCAVTFFLLSPVPEVAPFLQATEALPTTTAGQTCLFYGDFSFTVLVLTPHCHGTWPFTGTSVGLDTHPVLQEDKLQTYGVVPDA